MAHFSTKMTPAQKEQRLDAFLHLLRANGLSPEELMAYAELVELRTYATETEQPLLDVLEDYSRSEHDDPKDAINEYWNRVRDLHAELP